MPPQTALYRRITLTHNCPEHVLHYSGRFWRWAARCALQRWSDLIRLQRRSRSLECQLMRWLRQMSTKPSAEKPNKKANIQIQDNKCACSKHKWKHRQLFQQSCSLQAAGTENTNSYSLWGDFYWKTEWRENTDRLLNHCGSANEILMHV